MYLLLTLYFLKFINLSEENDDNDEVEAGDQIGHHKVPFVSQNTHTYTPIDVPNLITSLFNSLFLQINNADERNG
jgi:hypothetical protein